MNQLLKLSIALLVLGMLVLSGCTQSGSTTNTTGSTTGDVVTTAPSADQIASDLSGGTGTGADDITNDDLEGLQNDLDSLGTDVDAAGQSNV